jgi:hypothetical protein
MFDALMQNKDRLLAIGLTLMSVVIAFVSAAYWGSKVREMKINPKTGRYESPKKPPKKK